MNIVCPKCGDDKIFKRTTVSSYETHSRTSIRGRICEVKTKEPKFYTCYKCWYKFNIK